VGHPQEKTEMNPKKSGYANVNGIKPYHEIYGEGELASCATKPAAGR